jgi:hypothetical protein
MGENFEQHGEKLSFRSVVCDIFDRVGDILYKLESIHYRVMNIPD